MNLLAGNLALLGPQIEGRLFDIELPGQVFDRQEHRQSIGGVSRHPRAPWLRSRQHASAGNGGWATLRSIERVLLKPSGPVHALSVTQHLRLNPAPGRKWGAGFQ